jgi:hypothetical protein
MLQSCCLRLDESILNVASGLWREDWPSLHGLGNGILPRPEQAFHGFSGVRVYHGVGIHKRPVEIPAQIDGVRSADVLDNRVQYIERRQLGVGSSLIESAVGRLRGSGAYEQRLTCRI